jgi:hypothetical protein
MGTVDKPERLCAQAAPLFVGKLVAPLAGLLAYGFPINLLGSNGLFHLQKILHRKWPVAKSALLNRAWHGVCVHSMWRKD